MTEPGEPTAIEKKILHIALGNREIVKRLDKMGFDTTNVRDNHLQFFVNYLIEAGILTAQQVWDFQLQWETHLGETLANLEVQGKKMLEDIRRAAVEQQRLESSRLATPTPKTLLVPGDSRRGRRPIRDNPQA